MTRPIHQAEQYRSAIPGVQAVTFYSGRHFPRHSHDQFGIGVIESGGHRSWSGVGTVRASAGDVIMVNPGEMHDGAPLGETARAWRMIYLDPAVIARQVEHEIAGSAELVRPVASDPLLARRFAALFASLTADRPDPLEREENLLRSVICLLHHHGMATLRPTAPSPSVARAVERLDSAPEAQTSLAELAALSGVSRFQLLRGFAREVGITPHAYLVQRRVCLARRLLASGRSPIEAALEAGFADQSHMTRAFVRQFGVTPSRYRAALA